MASTIHEIRALLLQFERSALRDFYLRSGEWKVFMARDAGAANPMLGAVEEDPAPETAPVTAPHLGMFEPRCAAGDRIEKGALVGLIDVLGRKTEVISQFTGRVAAVHADTLVEFGDSLADLEIAA